MRLLVLGGGQQGRVIADNLAARPETTEVVVADLAPPAGALAARARFQATNALDAASVRAAASGADAAVTALPGAIGHRALPILIEAGVPVVDVAFTPEPQTTHDALARKARVPVVVDCGVAPGLSHVLAAEIRRELGGLDALAIHVGGLPLDPPPAFRHAVYFNARDLLDEYIRPARMIRAGRPVAPHPLDEAVEQLVDEEVGPLEAFASDGLRSLVDSFPDVPHMAEMTLRVPGHLDAMRALRAMGLLEGDAATDAVAHALARRFPAARHPDRLLMEVRGRRGARRAARRLHAVAEGGASAMSRTTGFTAAAVAVALARGDFREPGVHVPERLGEDPGVVKRVLDDLARHGLAVESRSRLAPAL